MMAADERINAANEIARAICKKTCFSENCGLCPLFMLKKGIDNIENGMKPKDAIKIIVADGNRELQRINGKYDAVHDLTLS